MARIALTLSVRSVYFAMACSKDELKDDARVELGLSAWKMKII